MPKYCTNCGAPLESGQTKCSNCGKEVVITNQDNNQNINTNQTNINQDNNFNNQNNNYNNYNPNMNNNYNNYNNSYNNQGYNYNNQNYNNNYNQGYNNMYTNDQPKNRIVAGLLGIFVGYFGVHNFYLGYTSKGVAQLLITILSLGLLSGISAIWGFVEGIMILTGSINTDSKGRRLVD